MAPRGKPAGAEAAAHLDEPAGPVDLEASPARPVPADPPAAGESVAPRPLRRDARRNRERILAAARAAFAEHGLDVGVDEIARRAGVGMGTLYRRFPTKDALIEAILEDRLEEVVALLERAVGGHDPWRDFEGFMSEVVALQARDRGFKDILASSRRDEPRLTAARDRIAPLMERLLARAQAAGEMRADVDPRDVGPLLWGAGRVVESTGEVAPDYWRRYLTLVLDGLRAPGAAPRDLPAPPLTDEQAAAAMQRYHGRGAAAARDG
jgi:AcrR family transcriptional regulator